MYLMLFGYLYILIYLQNLNNNRVSKETEIPKDILNKIGEDSLLRFKDGQYIYEEDLTEKFRDSLIDVEGYMNNEKN